ncbi:MAG: NADH-quinone oxidoreductase subunit A [Chloroflexi bacterium]|nr:NADH-quinone oxidoreductase subunit A [Chloroflexota bacterium]
MFDYTAVLLAAVIGAVVVGLLLGLARLLAPRRTESLKGVTYECGMLPMGQGWAQYHVRYYLFAMLFVIFEVEAVFLFPWAVVLETVGNPAFIEMMIFLAILLFGLAYAWKKGILEWER